MCSRKLCCSVKAIFRVNKYPVGIFAPENAVFVAW